MLIPWFLIIIGAIFLLENLKLIPAIKWSIVWPVLLILAGIYLLRKKCGGRCCGWREKKPDKHD